MPIAQLIEPLTTLLGEDAVISDGFFCALYSQDLHTKEQVAGAIIRPDSTHTLSQAVKMITSAGIAVIPRGGGTSHTRSYVPVDKDSIIVDMAALNQVLEVNVQDMYVRVECGCSWQKLYEILQPIGYRTPYFGTLSGRLATIGGSLSQNAYFWGSGQYGFAADAVISLDVVLADGKVVKTGAASQTAGTPFVRHYGSDLTGLFCGDSSALGIKAIATLRLIPQLPYSGHLSLRFEHQQQQFAAMCEVARQGLASEVVGLDPRLQKQWLAHSRCSTSMIEAIKASAKRVLPGRKPDLNTSWTLHYIVEDRTSRGIDERLSAIRTIAKQHQAREIENTLPKALRATRLDH